MKQLVFVFAVSITFVVNHTFAFKGQFVRIDDTVALLTGEFSLSSVADMESTDISVSTLQGIKTTKERPPDSPLSVDSFPFCRKGVFDLFQNAAIGVHCSAGLKLF